MPRYVMIMEHPPNICPNSNKASRAAAEKLPSQLPEASQKYKVKLLSDNVLAPHHVIILVVEAPSIEAVRDLVDEIGLSQWNDVKIYCSVTLQEAMQIPSMKLPTLF